MPPQRDESDPACPDRARRCARAGIAATLALHALLLGGARALAVPLGMSDCDELLDDQIILISPDRAWPIDAACLSTDCCAELTPQNLREGDPESALEDNQWGQAHEVRACFGATAASPWTCLNRPDPALDPRRGAERLGLRGLAPEADAPALRNPAIALAAAAEARPHPSRVAVRALRAQGPIPTADFQELLQRRHGRFHACYERALRDDPWLLGSVEMTLALTSDEISVETVGHGGAEGHEALLCCLAGVLDVLEDELWAPEEGEQIVRYTLVLRPSGP